MKHVLARLGRFLLFTTSALGIATAANWSYYKNSNEAALKTQTVIFNVLSHSVPTKLSQALLAENEAELRRTLDSNYGLFGMVITDCVVTDWECPDQAIRYITQSHGAWSAHLQASDLRYHPFDFLRDPPPLLSEAGYENPRNAVWRWTGRRNVGKIIGRVYYIRDVPPGFWASYRLWFTSYPLWLASPRSMIGVYLSYTLTTGLTLIGGLIGWGIWESILRDRQRKEIQLLAQSQADWKKDACRLEQQLLEKINQSSQRLKEQENLLTTLQDYRADNYQRLQRLQQELMQQEQGLQALREQLSCLNGQGETVTLKLEIQERPTAIAFLKQEIDTTHQQTQVTETKLQELVQTNQLLRQGLQSLNERLSIVRQQLEQPQSDLDDHQPAYRELLKENYKQTLDEFERDVLTRLENNSHYKSGEWRVLVKADVSPTAYRQFVDFIVLSAYCAIAVEAKFYQGEIYPKGDVKKTTWLYRNTLAQTSGDIPCAGFKNPYEQVEACATMLNRRLNLRRWGKPLYEPIECYGIIVFPETADVSCLDSRIDKHYLITRVDYLVRLIEKLEDAERAKVDGQPATQPIRDRLTPLQLENLVTRPRRFIGFDWFQKSV